jgi:hypothetical protein
LEIIYFQESSQRRAKDIGKQQSSQQPEHQLFSFDQSGLMDFH